MFREVKGISPRILGIECEPIEIPTIENKLSDNNKQENDSSNRKAQADLTTWFVIF